MIDEKRMEQIRKRLEEANNGYGKVGHAEYCSDVKALLKELDLLKAGTPKTAGREKK